MSPISKWGPSTWTFFHVLAEQINESKYIELMKLICKKIIKLPDISENTPPAIAAGVIYFISYLCNLNISKKNVSDICKISEVTINKCFKKLDELQDQLIPLKIKEKYAFAPYIK